MNIIKEIRLQSNRTNDKGETHCASAICVIRSDCSGSALSTFNQFAEIARETYPDIKDEDIKIVQFGKQFYKRTFGIEFEPTDGRTLHDGWKAISELGFPL